MENGMVQPEWRVMQADDLPRIFDIAAIVHPDFPEEEAVFRDRFKIYPDGCFVLCGINDIIGYGVSHPWQMDSAPALDSVLGQLPENSTTYYVHDIALLPAARGSRAASRVVAKMAKRALQDGFSTMALIAVNGSLPFWEKQGFVARDVPALDGKLASYSDDARYMVRLLG